MTDRTARGVALHLLDAMTSIDRSIGFAVGHRHGHDHTDAVVDQQTSGLCRRASIVE